ncbi:AAA family ATPase [Guptibacillus algicola]|uniref:AAA family ATPase n=1 Tax=Guptibacillus algicola TaxID=225844 RepID=UPI001CD61CF1|nr:AAA family ATPase [Alkalihalobacillus algicola]MCA0988456.1 AAA family ATPase [Alkalihalobacillus algicola]
MIIMINGAFGVGKTTVSNELVTRVDNSVVFDPEEIGGMLVNLLPSYVKEEEAPTGDFQDLALWRELTVSIAKRTMETYQKNLIVPMTIRKPEYFHAIFDGFKRIDSETYHFCLTASKATITERLLYRGEVYGNWCFQQTDKCLEAFSSGGFGEYISTENRYVHDVVEIIMRRLVMPIL